MSCSIKNVFIVDVHVLCRKVKNSVGYLMDLVFNFLIFTTQNIRHNSNFSVVFFFFFFCFTDDSHEMLCVTRIYNGCED